MTRRSLVRAALVASVLPTFAGCALYVPSIAYAPLPERLGEVRVHAGLGIQSASLIASGSPHPGLLVYVAGETEWAGDDTVRTRSRRQIGGGIGGYGQLGSYGVAELLAGYDAGSVTTTENSARLFGPPERILTIREGSMSRLYGQLDMGLRGRIRAHPNVVAALLVSGRISSVRFTELSELRDGDNQPVPEEARLTVYEPGLVLLLSVGPTRLHAGYRFVLPLNRDEEISVQPFRSDVGLSMAIDRLFRGH